MIYRTLIASVLALAAASAVAEPAKPRAIDFTASIAALDGKPATECKDVGEKDGKPVCNRTGVVTLGEIAAAALSMPDRAANLEDQVRRGRLAQRVLDAKAAELTSDDVTLIKGQIAKLGLNPVWVAGAVEVLDPAAAKP